MRKNGTLTATEQKKALAKIDAELAAINVALEAFVAIGSPVSESLSAAWNGLYDAENALTEERRRVWLNIPASSIERIMANVD